MTFFWQSNLSLEAKNLKDDLNKLLSAINKSNFSLTEKPEIKKLATKLQFIVNNNELIGILIKYNYLEKGTKNETKYCQDLIRYISELNSSSEPLKEYSTNIKTRNTSYLNSNKIFHERFVNLFFLLAVGFLATLILGYIAFAIAIASLGHTSSVMLASKLFFDITGYGLLGSGAASLFAHLVTRSLVVFAVSAKNSFSLTQINMNFPEQSLQCLDQEDLSRIAANYTGTTEIVIEP